MAEWGYTTLLANKVPDSGILEELDSLGSAGWELVAVTSWVASGYTTPTLTYFFKRPRLRSL